MAEIDDIIANCQQARDSLNKAEEQGRAADQVLIEARSAHAKAREAIDAYIEAQLGK